MTPFPQRRTHNNGEVPLIIGVAGYYPVPSLPEAVANGQVLYLGGLTPDDVAQGRLPFQKEWVPYSPNKDGGYWIVRPLLARGPSGSRSAH